ncbi:MAG TPA: FHA domain-containing protein [Isosphaeraceae bacterium]|jgi:pSer/pThr/pTyr-binding forkhead associated (FHA) protein/anti-anti-sigma regulatory factor|nr:FHA domain-containing protein [Isosphaeraceae bacterium]
MSVMLLALAEGRPGRAIPVDLPDFVIGRDASCQLRLDHEAVGGRHCRIRRDGRRVVVEDLTAGTGGGTAINERAVRVAEVRHGDRLSVGPARFQFIIGQEDGGPAVAEPVAPPAGRVRLIVESGKVKGQAIEVSDERFLIGRDASCQLRPNNPTTSRKHAMIERRGGRIFVRDLGTTNGTVLNDRNLRGEEAEAADGDRLTIGPLAFTLSIEPIGSAIPRADSAVHRVLEEGPTAADEPTVLLLPTKAAPAAAPEPEPKAVVPAPAPRPASDPSKPVDSGLIRLSQLGLELVGDVLVVTIRTARLDDTESTAGPIRYGLATLLEQGYPHHVVVNFEEVESIARRSAGVIFGHAQRLVRARGLMRIVNLRPEVRAQIEELGLILPVEPFDSIDAAVRTPW